jgi:hypothetical protein
VIENWEKCIERVKAFIKKFKMRRRGKKYSNKPAKLDTIQAAGVTQEEWDRGEGASSSHGNSHGQGQMNGF